MRQTGLLTVRTAGELQCVELESIGDVVRVIRALLRVAGKDERQIPASQTKDIEQGFVRYAKNTQTSWFLTMTIAFRRLFSGVGFALSVILE